MNNAPQKPLLIAVGGLSGSGKTSLAASLAARLPNTVHLDSDRVRKEVFGVSATTRLPAEAYAPEGKARVVAEMRNRVSAALSSGQNVIVSETFISPELRAEEEQLAKDHGAGFKGLWLKADLFLLFDRVANRVNDASDATPAVVKMQSEKDQGIVGWAVIDATQPREKVLAAALKILKPAKPAGKAPGPRS